MKTFRYFLLFLTVIFIVPNFINYNIIESDGGRLANDKFDKSLVRLNTLAKLEAYIDSTAIAKKITPGSLDYAIEAKEIVSYRFYHKYATQNLNENWIASVAQKLTGLYLSSKIVADDILTKPYGYCGQQSAVLMELLQRKKLECRALYLPHHFVIQANIDGTWYYFDVNAEPDIPKEKRADESWLKNKDTLARIYNRDIQWIGERFGDPVSFKYGEINEVQGPNAQIFQSITKRLSKTIFLIPLLWFVYLKKKTSKLATIHSE